MKKTRFLRILTIALALICIAGCALAEGSFVDKVEAVNGALDELKADGTIDAILAKYIKAE